MLEFPNVAHNAAHVITDALPSDIRYVTETHNAINADMIPQLADLLQLTIAIVVATILDAGSERDVVLEDENLTEALLNTLKEWSE